MHTIDHVVALIPYGLEQLVGWIWNLPLVIFLIGTGLVLSVLLGGIQFRGFFHALQVVRGKYDKPDDPGEISHFQALCAALSATVGLGNIAGVAIAIKMGGPGATFWMILAGVAGMATKFAECSLAVMYRKVDENRVVHGGPMHYIELGLGKKFKPMAIFFAIACCCAALGAGNMFQANQVAESLQSSFGLPPLMTGLILAVTTAAVIIGGIKRIGEVASRLVPFMGIIYLASSLVVIFLNIEKLPELLMTIFREAFTGSAAIGGMTGLTIKEIMIQGVRRACFSNEAGFGSASIAHSAAATKEPIREGVVALLEPFIDTIVICTMTALVISISGVWHTQDATGVTLTTLAFDSAIPGFGKIFVPVAVFLFAYSTLISWSYYGERSIDYLFGAKAILPYKLVFCLVIVLGATWKVDPVLNFSDSMLGIMVLPNVIAIWLLFPKLKAATELYFAKLKRNEF